jgi:DNA-binding response OmpR family regulator
MKKLLVIDDDEAVRKLLRFRLKNSYEIMETDSPENALAIALEKKPDAILLDLMMPKYSGFEVCQTISSLSFTQHIPILIVSGESSANYKEFCESIGAKDFVQKPVDFDLLERKLSKLMSATPTGEQNSPRVRLRVMLRLRASNDAKDGADALTPTETVSADGFVCAYAHPVNEGDVLDVYHARNGQQMVGRAKAVRVEWSGTPGQRVSFTFVGKPTDWVLR